MAIKVGKYKKRKAEKKALSDLADVVGKQKGKEGKLGGLLSVLSPLAGMGGGALATALLGGATVASGGLLAPLVAGLGASMFKKGGEGLLRGAGMGADISQIKGVDPYGFTREAAEEYRTGMGEGIKERGLTPENILADVAGSYISSFTPKLGMKDGKLGMTNTLKETSEALKGRSILANLRGETGLLGREVGGIKGMKFAFDPGGYKDYKTSKKIGDELLGTIDQPIDKDALDTSLSRRREKVSGITTDPEDVDALFSEDISRFKDTELAKEVELARENLAPSFDPVGHEYLKSQITPEIVPTTEQKGMFHPDKIGGMKKSIYDYFSPGSVYQDVGGEMQSVQPEGSLLDIFGMEDWGGKSQPLSTRQETMGEFQNMISTGKLPDYWGYAPDSDFAKSFEGMDKKAREEFLKSTQVGYKQGGKIPKYYGGGNVQGKQTITDYFSMQGKTLSGSDTQSIAQKLGRR